MTTTTMTMEELTLNGVKYVLNQCECADGIWQWFQTSKVGEFTRYYLHTIFHTDNGFWAGYNDNLTNGAYV